MIRGHVTIDLHNHHSGFTERIEKDNLVTDAVGILASVYAGANNTNLFMPIAEKALGGLMLFDGTLEEDAANIWFPGSVHLTGYAGQWENTDNPLFGSINRMETHATQNGYETVWDFSTSQANGIIAALARTAAPGSVLDNNIFTGYMLQSMHSLNTSINIENDRRPIIQLADQMLYTIKHLEYSRTKDSGSGIYTFQTKAAVKKEYIPIRKYKTADHVNRSDPPEHIKEITLKTKTPQNILVNKNTNMHSMNILNGYDGYAYCVNAERNESGDGRFHYQRIKISDGSFDVEEQVTVSLPGIHLEGNTMSAAVCRGKCFLLGYDNRYIYIVDLANTADVRTADAGNGRWWFWYSDYYNTNIFTTDPGGTVRAAVGEYTENNKYNFSNAIVYPDGYVLINRPYVENENYVYNGYKEVISNMTESLVGYVGVLGKVATNYLGTICNLAEPITKTAATSMKITYTLTDEVQE